jgi:response regulator RpfG family c-di-GMP phosphodiesterase
VRADAEATNQPIVGAADGDEALEIANTVHADATIVDLAMPQVDGLKMIAWIRSEPALWDMTIIEPHAHPVHPQTSSLPDMSGAGVRVGQCAQRRCVRFRCARRAVGKNSRIHGDPMRGDQILSIAK